MIFIYTTCKDVAEAKRLGARIIKSRLAACVNVWPMESMYMDDGEITEDAEAVLLVKTNEQKLQDIEPFLEKHHTYSTPFVGAVDIRRINRAYKEWAAQTIA